jgi:hypothetical protein
MKSLKPKPNESDDTIEANPDEDFTPTENAVCPQVRPPRMAKLYRTLMLLACRADFAALA